MTSKPGRLNSPLVPWRFSSPWPFVCVLCKWTKVSCAEQCACHHCGDGGQMFPPNKGCFIHKRDHISHGFLFSVLTFVHSISLHTYCIRVLPVDENSIRLFNALYYQAHELNVTSRQTHSREICCWFLKAEVCDAIIAALSGKNNVGFKTAFRVRP